MKIAIMGAGFTGLTAALRLAKLGHQITVFEKESTVGGLAAGFKEKGWDWFVDKTYHHLFTNDIYAIHLAREVNQKLITKQPETAVLVDNKMSAFDSPITLLKFSHLTVFNRFRVGICTFYLKYLSSAETFESRFALDWLNKFMGESATKTIWDPLFEGKFGSQKYTISLTWFWARIKKRTQSLVYPEGGFQHFAEKISQEITDLGGKIILDTEIKTLKKGFDKTIITLPTPTFTKITKLPKPYQKRLDSIPHLSALNLIIKLKKPFFTNGTYWLNITDKSFPFLVMAEHTNFMNKKYYNNQHILYIGCYLPADHPYLKMSGEKLFKVFDPYLKKINPNYALCPKPLNLFTFSNAQPIVTPNHKTKIPAFKTPLKNVFLANLDMVYPWDRGVNYAINLGEEVAKMVNGEK
ncbi:MAG: FAD-dependent oxidoreductase [Microgenomates group bacterium]|jgi:protoporphyrinogen oxidase